MSCIHGGKQRIGLKIARNIHLMTMVLDAYLDYEIKGYCEPFCGMLGVYRHIPELFKNHQPLLKYKAGDINPSIVLMWQKAQKGWIPPTTATEEEYDRLKHANDSALRGYIGHQYSFGCQFFNGYAPKYGKTKDSSKASQNVVDIAHKLKNVKFSSGPYTQYSGLKGYIIYCDPPYEGTVSRYYQGRSDKKLKFDVEEFWEWCRRMSEHNIVFVSSYQAPEDFTVIMQSTHKLTGIAPGKNEKTRVEKLYYY